MTTKEIRELSTTEIDTKLRETRDQLLQLRLRKQTGQVEKPHLLHQYRKDIARLETILHAKKQAPAAGRLTAFQPIPTCPLPPATSARPSSALSPAAWATSPSRSPFPTGRPHAKYQKVINRQTVVHVHDEKNEAKVGDKVEVMETRPLSRLKRWRLVRVVEAAKTGIAQAISEAGRGPDRSHQAHACPGFSRTAGGVSGRTVGLNPQP